LAASEVYDFVSTISPDYAATLGVTPQGVVSEESSKSQVIHTGVDGSEERISFTTTSIFYITLNWNVLTEADSGTIFEWYNNSAKANGMQRSFRYAYGDGHTYVVRFDSPLPRSGQHVSRYGLTGVRMKVLGRIAD